MMVTQIKLIMKTKKFLEFVKISMKKKAIIISIKGTSLSNKEKSLCQKKIHGD